MAVFFIYSEVKKMVVSPSLTITPTHYVFTYERFNRDPEVVRLPREFKITNIDTSRKNLDTILGQFPEEQRPHLTLYGEQFLEAYKRADYKGMVRASYLFKSVVATIPKYADKTD